MSGQNLTLKIWRQKDAKTKGQFETVKINDVSPDMSFLEMLDIVNEEQMKQGKEGFAFDHDCREGICGMCSLCSKGIPLSILWTFFKIYAYQLCKVASAFAGAPFT